MNKEFTTQSLNEKGIEVVNGVRGLFNELLNELEQYCPPSREFSIVRTKLEEACFFAVKSACSVRENQK